MKKLKQKSLKITSWNVNGIRAVCKKNFLESLKQMDSDVLCLQEVKAKDKDVPVEVKEHPDYIWYGVEAEKAGYSGVGTLIKREVVEALKVETDLGQLGIEKFDREGRTLIHRFPKFWLFNVYVPNGQRDLNRVPFKLEYHQKLRERLLGIQKEKGATVVCGDINTAHHPIDLANPKANKKTTGFLEEERAFLDEWVKDGNVDLFRHFHPEKGGEYTWWTYRNNCRERNIGWRIDYFFGTDLVRKRALKCYHDPQILGSDHCPLHLEMTL